MDTQAGRKPFNPASPRPALDITLDGQAASDLRAMLGDDPEEPSPVRLLVGDGHSGNGLYAAAAEYPEEGAIFLKAIEG